MPEHIPDSRPVIRCRGTADFLAALPHVTGFTATDSLFVVGFICSRSGPAVRIDLPANEEPGETIAILDFISGLARDLAAAHHRTIAAAVVITSSESFTADGAPPWHRLARRLERRLRRDGVEVRELCVVAVDGWASLLDPRSPRAARPLSEIAESPVSRGALRHADPPVDLDELGEIPLPAPARAAAVKRALEQYPPFDFPGSERVPPRRSEPGSLPDGYFTWIADAASIARELREDGLLSAETTAHLIRSTEHSDRWLVIALGLLTRPEFPVELAHEMPAGRFAGVPVDHEAETGALGWSVFRILAGVCPEFSEHGRLRAVCDRLIAVIAETPESLRPGVFALSAWLWWLYGSQTVARRHVQAALRIDASHEIALMVQRLTSQQLAPRFRAAVDARPDAEPRRRSLRGAPR